MQSQYAYAMSHKGKAIGSTLGIIAGVSYGLAAKHSNWATAGLAIGGAVGGAILGGMFDKQPTVVIPVDDNGNAKAPVVADTVGEETANDTAGDDGMMSGIGGNCGQYTADECAGQGFDSNSLSFCNDCVRCNKTYPNGAAMYTTMGNGEACPSGSAGGQGGGTGFQTIQKLTPRITRPVGSVARRSFARR